MALVVLVANLVSHLGNDATTHPTAQVAPQAQSEPIDPSRFVPRTHAPAPNPFYEIDHDTSSGASDAAAGRRDYKLAQAYARGDGVMQNDAHAADLYEQAAKEGNAPAQYELGVRHHQGHNEVKDDVYARSWWEKAAQQGNVDAQYSLGDLLARSGKVKDYAAAEHWWQLAALKGQVQAQEGMGWLALNGLGAVRNNNVAYYWFRKAAGKGNILATTELASMYDQGTGPVHSPRIALALMTLAIGKDRSVEMSYSQMMARLQTVLNSAQRASARALAASLIDHDTFEERLVRAEQEDTRHVP
jgi:TPR repeat protein